MTSGTFVHPENNCDMVLPQPARDGRFRVELVHPENNCDVVLPQPARDSPYSDRHCRAASSP